MDLDQVRYIEWLITALMVGIVWYTQVIQYPLFHIVPPDRFVDFHSEYTQKAGWLIGPLMVLELGFGILKMKLLPPKLRRKWTNWIPLFLLSVIWLSTFLVQVPLHGVLVEKKTDEVIHLLIWSNWVRTILWSLKLVWLGKSNPIGQKD